MGKEKHGFLTPKAIANRIKSKGLQKLRWYCQMCQKQCRDENGFKCHMSSESHQRQLLLFAENPDKILDSFSKDFEDGYLELLKRRFGTKRVQANVVYQEYIAFKEHVHMNSTQWETLTDFVKYLGKDGNEQYAALQRTFLAHVKVRVCGHGTINHQLTTSTDVLERGGCCIMEKGKCIVDDTEKGWFVTYVDRDPETIRRQEAIKAKEKMDVDDQDRTMKFIEKQIKRAGGSKDDTAEYTELKRDDEEEKITFSLGGVKKSEVLTKNPVLPVKSALSLFDREKSSEKPKSVSAPKADKRKAKSALDEIMETEEKKKEKQNRKDYWLTPDIVVKVVNKQLGHKYYKKKAVVKEVNELYSGIIKMLDTGDKIRIDQTHVETVIPGIGKSVLMVNGAYRGEEAVLEKLDEKKFCCSVRINKGLLRGRLVDGVQYEDLSKLHQGS